MNRALNVLCLLIFATAFGLIEFLLLSCANESCTQLRIAIMLNNKEDCRFIFPPWEATRLLCQREYMQRRIDSRFLLEIDVLQIELSGPGPSICFQIGEPSAFTFPIVFLTPG